MHFNDLLIKLRTQALAGVAALSALVGIFAKTESAATNWRMASLVFAFLIAFWIAIWIIDFFYYNRLLHGAVKALVDLEKLSKTEKAVRHLDISTTIEKAVAGDVDVTEDRWRRLRLGIGRYAFYIVVFIALCGGLFYSNYQYRHTNAAPIAPWEFNAVP